MTDQPQAKPLSLKEIENLADPDYLRRGVDYYDRKLVLNPARFENKLYAEVKGSGDGAYKVTITFAEQVKARCTCPSARRTTYCKHAVAVMVTWSKAPESFLVAESAPFLDASGKAKARVKKGKSDTREIQEKGLDAAEKLLGELATVGLAAVTFERVNLIRGLAHETRNHKLVRLSAALVEFTDLLEKALGTDTFSINDYAEKMTDIVFTVKAIRKYWREGSQNDFILEDLIGKTWRKDSLPIKTGFQLIEADYQIRQTSDDFRIAESLLFSLDDGKFFTEKQITPPKLTKREPLKESYGGRLVHVHSARLYPGFPPARIHLEERETRSGANGALDRILEFAVGDWNGLLESYREIRKDLFAPISQPVLLKPARTVVERDGMMLLDCENRGLFAPLTDNQIDLLCRGLENAGLAAVFGELEVGRRGFNLTPLSVVKEARQGWEVFGLRATGGERQ